VERAVRLGDERVHDTGGWDGSTLDSLHETVDLLFAEGKNRVENVLICEGGIAMRQAAQQQCDEVDVLLGRVTSVGVPLKAARDGLETILELARAPKGMSLGGGEGGSAAVGRAAG
jgi:hypothetical protein